jgi:aldose 1-epimerase
MPTLLAGILCFTVATLFAAVSHAQENTASKDKKMKISTEKFGTTPEGNEITLYTLTNAQGIEVKIINFGAIIQSLKTPDRNGKLADIVLGFDNLKDYVGKHPYFGAIVGRYGNRICKGKFTLDGKEYTLPINNPPNSLHGGLKGFDKLVWAATPFEDADSLGLKLTMTSPDGDEGYPGALTVTLTYTLTNDNQLKMHYEATTDAPTVLNLTNHSYFNLDGAGQGDILDQVITINADRFTPVDETMIPTGELRKVEGTPLDFRKAKPLGRDIAKTDEQLKLGLGYDHNFILNKAKADAMTLAARAQGPESGRVLEVFTTEPGIQLYSGNFLDSTNVGKGGITYAHRFGFCLETQHYPDSPNKPDFPTVILKPGEKYDTITIYKFSAE